MAIQSDPPYPEGVFTNETSNPEVHRIAAYPEVHPGDDRQREPSRAVTRLKKDDWSTVKECNVNPGTRIREDAKEDNESDDSSGPLCKDGPADCNDDWTMHQWRRRRPEQAPATLRESVAPSGSCNL
ncbi:hypothetical protein NDU88_004433 [Pleurodeles waltl]|uniref:Uncharacterized protein n=1 Tax=Pleurodeles waltl TaxID=8319 RepID=A0AAV7RLC3_PLEWA|nr:hypothetical protein NDU88_004433 [Pleurodeles waltl]